MRFLNVTQHISADRVIVTFQSIVVNLIVLVNAECDLMENLGIFQPKPYALIL